MPLPPGRRAPRRLSRPGAGRTSRPGARRSASSRPSHGRPSSYGRRRSRDDSDDRGYERRSYGRGARKKSPLPIILGIGGVAIAVIVIAVVASGGGGYSKPEDTCLAYFRALRNKDPYTAYDLLSSSAVQGFENKMRSLDQDEVEAVAAAFGIEPREVMTMSPRELFVTAFKKMAGVLGSAGFFQVLDEIEVGEARIEGSSATVMVYAKGTDVGFPVPLVKEGGVWKMDQRP
jgi:hypothetical protein